MQNGDNCGNPRNSVSSTSSRKMRAAHLLMYAQQYTKNDFVVRCLTYRVRSVDRPAYVSVTCATRSIVCFPFSETSARMQIDSIEICIGLYIAAQGKTIRECSRYYVNVRVITLIVADNVVRCAKGVAHRTNERASAYYCKTQVRKLENSLFTPNWKILNARLKQGKTQSEIRDE